LADSRREHDQAHGKDAKPCDHEATGVEVHKLGRSQAQKSSIRLLPAGADDAAFCRVTAAATAATPVAQAPRNIARRKRESRR
jgi:hypothetical protein